MDSADQVVARCRMLAAIHRGARIHDANIPLRAHARRPRIRRQLDDGGGDGLLGRSLRAISAAGTTARRPDAARLYIGSHLDTVPRAGRLRRRPGRRAGHRARPGASGTAARISHRSGGFLGGGGSALRNAVLGQSAFVGETDGDLLDLEDSAGITVFQAIQSFGLDPSQLALARANRDGLGFLEFHIEQGPVLEDLGYPVALVDAIVGQTRLFVNFQGKTNHAGTTPMNLRRDALAGAAEWIVAVERMAVRHRRSMRATVGLIEVHPGAINVIPGDVRVSLDARHADDFIRDVAVDAMISAAREIAARRGLEISVEPQLDQASVAMDRGLTDRLERAVEACGLPVHRMTSGAGHDAMIVARRMPAAMLFLRSPGGVSHHPDENVLPEDVAAALKVGARFLEDLEESIG